MKRLFCTAGLLIFTMAAVAAAKQKSNWVLIKNAHFSFSAPPDLKDQKVKGIDSFVGKYNSKHLELLFDYGWYPFTFNDWPAETKYEELSIDGRSARIGSVRHQRGYSRPWSTQVFIPAVWKKKSESKFDRDVGLSIFVNCETESDVAVARDIFKSLKFASAR